MNGREGKRLLKFKWSFWFMSNLSKDGGAERRQLGHGTPTLWNLQASPGLSSFRFLLGAREVISNGDHCYFRFSSYLLQILTLTNAQGPTDALLLNSGKNIFCVNHSKTKIQAKFNIDNSQFYKFLPPLESVHSFITSFTKYLLSAYYLSGKGTPKQDRAASMIFRVRITCK